MGTLLKLVSLFFVLLFAVGVLVQLLTWRKRRAVRPWAIVIGQAAAFASMVLFSVLTARPPGPLAWTLLLGAGFLAGLVYGGFVRVVRTPAGVLMGYTLPWIVTWALLMIATQLTTVLARQVPAVTVYTPDGRVRGATGQHGVEAWEGEVARFDPKAPAPVPGTSPSIPPQEFPGIAAEQVKVLRETADPKSVAKALDRLDDIAQRSEVKVLDFAVDEDLARLAAAIKKNPEKAARMLEDAGLSMEEFADRALEAGRELQEKVRGWNHVGLKAGD